MKKDDLSRFPSITEIEVLSDDMMENIESGSPCKYGCQPGCKNGGKYPESPSPELED